MRWSMTAVTWSITGMNRNSLNRNLKASCSLLTRSVGLPPPFQSEQFCAVTAEGGEYGAMQNHPQARPRALWITLSSV
jgi:hypothetical protein